MLMSDKPHASARVLMVAPQPFYEDRGTPIAIRHVLEALSKAGHLVDMLTFSAGSDISLPGLRILRVGGLFGIKNIPIGFSLKKLLLDVVMTFALLRKLRKPDYWCVHAVEEAVFPALVIGRHRGVPVIYCDGHGELVRADGVQYFPVPTPTKPLLWWSQYYMVYYKVDPTFW